MSVNAHTGGESVPREPSQRSSAGTTGNDSASRGPDQQKSSPAREKVQIEIPPTSIADNEAIISRLTDIINTVYTKAETGIFSSAYRRTYDDEVRKLIQRDQLALAWLLTSPTSTSTEVDAGTGTAVLTRSPETLIGCIRVEERGADRGVFSILACDMAFQGSGTGSALIRFAEEQCRARGKTIMQCELIVPVEFAHPVKNRMQAWYNRLGYNVVRNGDFAAEYPHISEHMITQSEYRVFEKALV